MKIKLVLLVLCTTFFLSQAQDKQNPTIHKLRNGTIGAVEFSLSEESPSSAQAFFEEYLKIKPDDDFRKEEHRSKREEFVHEHYDQYYKGVEVVGGGYNFHFRDGKMYFANGHYIPVVGLNATPSISLEEGIDSFLKYKGIDKEKVVDTITRVLIKEINNVIDNDTSSTVQLVYRIYLSSDAPNNNEVGYVNAHTGKVVATEPRLMDATATFATRYSGTRQAETSSTSGGYRLYDNSRGANIHTKNMQNTTTVISNAVELIDNDNNWTAAEHAASKNDMGLDVHWALQEIYDYLYNNYNINSFNNAGKSIEAFVRYGAYNFQRDNASWDPTYKVLYFGQGYSIYKPVANLDIVAHEFGHGITDFQIGWGISGDPRAFHEGLSDIWGAILEQRIQPSSTWRIGEQVMANGKAYLRNLQSTNDSNADTPIADTFGSSQYNGGDPYVRSGVFSHWFYILANGESGTNDLGNNYNVSGIGFDLAEELIVEAVFNNYLDGTTTYPAIRTATVNAAKAIFCENTPEVYEIEKAWYAVGVGSFPSQQVMEVAGPTSFCSNGTFTLSNLPAGASLSWNVTPAQHTSTVVNGNSITVTRLNNAVSSVFITANITGSNGCTTEVQYESFMGVPRPIAYDDFGQEIVFTNACVNVHHNITFTPPPNASQWQWTKVSGNFNLQSSNNSGTIIGFQPTSGLIEVKYKSSACNEWSVASLIYVNISSSCGGGFDPFSVYPNPASSELNIDISESNFTEEGAKFEGTYQIELINQNTLETVYTTESSERKLKIALGSFKEGAYYLHIRYKEAVIRKQVVIKR